MKENAEIALIQSDVLTAINSRPDTPFTSRIYALLQAAKSLCKDDIDFDFLVEASSEVMAFYGREVVGK